MHIVNDNMEGDNSVQRGVSLTSSNPQWTNLQPSQSKVSSKSHIKCVLSIFGDIKINFLTNLLSHEYLHAVTGVGVSDIKNTNEWRPILP